MMTLDEWAALDEDEPGELVDGLLEEEEVPTTLHEAVVSWLIGFFRAWVAPAGGWVFGSEHKLAVAPKRGRKPDVVVYLPGSKLPGRRASMARVPPDIAVEVISPTPRDGRRDRVDKKKDYAVFGVRYYWLLDPELRTLEVHVLGQDGRYTDALSAAEGQHAVPGCEGLIVDLDALWAELDRLPADD